MSDHYFEFHESRVTLGGGSRKREVVTWECVWLIPDELRKPGKPAQIIGVSKISKPDAEEKARILIADFLEN